ncbi:MAG: MFS transporter [Flavobacteriaceae bacterium]|jgi:FHS family L-fucose permease-like MFS transporter|nr:MFS transporter [Flavobacteriaceae bacterium]|tara:strand:+ start:41629 stop:43275 length:1647 start_codon:yes stop_codon:yes gene_type:complete
MKNQNNNSALYTLITVFFFWGFFGASNGVFIPFCKTYFKIDQFQAQLVEFAFYGAYFIGALILFIWSSYSKKDILNNWGYKKGIIYGLIISIFGALIMYPSVNGAEQGDTQVFYYVLLALFIIGLGFSLQQTAANPFAVSLGDPSTGSNRLNLAGGVNSFGTAIGPILIAFVLFGSASEVDWDIIELSSVQGLYIAVAVAFLLVAIFFYVSKNLPDAKNNEPFESASKAKNMLITMTVVMTLCFGWIFYTYTPSFENEPIKSLEMSRLILTSICLVSVFALILLANSSARKNSEDWGALKYPQLAWGMLAIFTYVGVEVTIQSNLGELLKADIGEGLNALGLPILDEAQSAKYIALYWGGLMIGRWTGSIGAFDISKSLKQILLFITPFIAFGVVIGVNALSNPLTASEIGIFSLLIVIQIIGFYLAKDNAIKIMTIFSALGVIAMLIGIFGSGEIALFAFLTGGLFCSIMWPCIFSLSITGLGKYTSQGSSFLVMMILGGAIIPPLQGKLADIFGMISSYWVAVLCFVFLLIYSITTKKILSSQKLI